MNSFECSPSLHCVERLFVGFPLKANHKACVPYDIKREYDCQWYCFCLNMILDKGFWLWIPTYLLLCEHWKGPWRTHFDFTIMLMKQGQFPCLLPVFRVNFQSEASHLSQFQESCFLWYTLAVTLSWVHCGCRKLHREPPEKNLVMCCTCSSWKWNLSAIFNLYFVGIS